MSQAEHHWRQLTPQQQAEWLAWRKAHGQPWHSPPHRPNFGHLRFHQNLVGVEVTRLKLDRSVFRLNKG